MSLARTNALAKRLFMVRSRDMVSFASRFAAGHVRCPSGSG